MIRKMRRENAAAAAEKTKNTTMKMKESSEFEFCKVCRINHNQGRRHNFFPRHTESVSSLFSRFRQKLSDVKSSLKNPRHVLPSDYSYHRIWCIFCDSEIDELGSSFSSGNAIKHLASEDHLKNLKHFLWKYGGGMDKLESFRITEAELAKWEKKCEVLKKEAASSSKQETGPSCGQSNDIQPNYEIVNNFDKNNIQFIESNLSNNVVPLQYNTNENYQVYHSDISEAVKVGSFMQTAASPMRLVLQHGLTTWNPTHISQDGGLSSLSASATFVADAVRAKVCKNQSIVNVETIAEGCQSLTRVFSGGVKDTEGNVHSGAPPPWLEGIESHNNNGQPGKPRLNSAPQNDRKRTKLNPKRVGAAWAEKRKMELEREKTGEITTNASDADWLPNFGRVWQSGSRKESMKEFKKEKLNAPKAEHQDTIEIKICPYVSKRMRRDTNGVSSEGLQGGAGIS